VNILHSKYMQARLFPKQVHLASALGKCTCHLATALASALGKCTAQWICIPESNFLDGSLIETKVSIVGYFKNCKLVSSQIAGLGSKNMKIS
jgi:hypothetical protein